jgi:hypothetical protein
VDIVNRGLETLSANTSAGADTTTLRDEKFWLAATRAESLIALGDKSGEDLMKEALASAPAAWMANSTRSQRDRLLKLMAAAAAGP